MLVISFLVKLQQKSQSVSDGINGVSDDRRLDSTSDTLYKRTYHEG